MMEKGGVCVSLVAVWDGKRVLLGGKSILWGGKSVIHGKENHNVVVDDSTNAE
jgi:hypothetical protein